MFSPFVLFFSPLALVSFRSTFMRSPDSNTHPTAVLTHHCTTTNSSVLRLTQEELLLYWTRYITFSQPDFELPHASTVYVFRVL